MPNCPLPLISLSVRLYPSHLVAVLVTGEGGEEVAGGGLMDVVKPGAVGAADVALLVLWTPLSARHHVTSGNKRKFYLFIENII